MFKKKKNSKGKLLVFITQYKTDSTEQYLDILFSFVF